MREAPADTVQLIAGLLTHMKQIVGDGASYAMLHYGAVEEGKRIGSAYGPHDLPALLQRLDAIFLHHSQVVSDDGAAISVRVEKSPLLSTGQRSAQGIVLGLLEGALAASRHGRFKGAAVQGGEGTLFELKREG